MQFLYKFIDIFYCVNCELSLSFIVLINIDAREDFKVLGTRDRSIMVRNVEL